MKEIENISIYTLLYVKKDKEPPNRTFKVRLLIRRLIK